jgi:hypothetical protein
MSSDDTEEALFFALLLREASVFVALFVFFFFFRLFFFPCICAFACEPTNNNNERTKTPKRKRVSLLPFVLPLLKRCHRNALPSSCSVQTRLLLFFFSFQLLSVGRFFFFLKPLKKAPSRVMERKSGEFF